MRKQVFKTALCLAIPVLLAVQPAIAESGEPQTMSVNGFDMQYLQAGSGPTLVLLHGFTSDMRTWQAMIPHLAKDFRVIAPTQRYFGKADWDKNWPPFNRDLLADDVASLIRGLNSGPVHLVGWSMGATVAHIASLRYPELVKSAYLFEGTARMKLDAVSAQENAAFTQKTWAPLIKQLKETGPQGTIASFINTVLGDPSAWDNLSEDKKTMYRDNARIFAFVGPKAAPKAIACEQIKASKVPTLYVYGTKSIEPFQRARKRFQDCVGTEPFEIVDGATHGWPRMDTDAFVKSVKAFASAVNQMQ